MAIPLLRGRVGQFGDVRLFCFVFSGFSLSLFFFSSSCSPSSLLFVTSSLLLLSGLAWWWAISPRFPSRAFRRTSTPFGPLLASHSFGKNCRLLLLFLFLSSPHPPFSTNGYETDHFVPFVCSKITYSVVGSPPFSMRFLNLFGLALATISSVNAQTFTNCNPLKKSCPADPALGTSHSWTFNQTLDDHIWDASNGHVDFTDEGAQLSIKEKLQSPTLQSKFYIFFGVVESHIKMAKGGGIVSSVVLQSDDLDEIDWEWVGYNTTGVQSNYYGKGNASSYGRGGYHYVPNADTEFHNYTTYWTKDKIEWWIDQELVRTLNYEDALEGRNFPQTPSNVRYGIWPAGDSGNAKGTIDWAGGVVDYDAGPYTMVVEKVRVQDFASGKEYEYKDNSGAWESINVVTYVVLSFRINEWQQC